MAAQYKVEESAANHFAWIRTRYAVDRTFMAWLRTAASMIGFGFTIVQFFQTLSKMNNVEAAKVPQTPTVLGLALIGTGVIALSIALYDYTAVVRHLDSRKFQDIADHEQHKSASIVSAIAVIATGIVAFGAILVRAVL